MKLSDKLHKELGYTFPKGYMVMSKNKALSHLAQARKRTLRPFVAIAATFLTIIGVSFFRQFSNSASSLKSEDDFFIEFIVSDEVEFDHWFEDYFLLPH